MSPKKLTVFSVNPSNMHRTPMASFALEGSAVKANFTSKNFRRQVEEGIHVMGKTFKLEDGAKFMDALEKAFSRNSTIVVERT